MMAMLLADVTSSKNLPKSSPIMYSKRNQRMKSTTKTMFLVELTSLVTFVVHPMAYPRHLMKSSITEMVLADLTSTETQMTSVQVVKTSQRQLMKSLMS